MTELPWLMAVATGLCNSAVALANKAAERAHCRAMPYAMVQFAAAGLTALVLAVASDANWTDGRLWAFGGTMGALYLAALAAMLRANRSWPPSLVWSAANMGFVVPILLSAIFPAESLRPVDAGIMAGVILMLVGLAEREGGGPDAATPTSATEDQGLRRWLPLSVVFLANGLLMLGFKLFGVMVPEAKPGALIAALYGCGAGLAALLQAGLSERQPRRGEIGLGAAAGLASGLSGLAILVAVRLPAAAAFPVVQGTSLVGGVLVCAWVFRERLTARKLAALTVGLAAMLLTLWR